MYSLPSSSFSTIILQCKLLDSTLFSVFSIKPVFHANFTIQRSPLNGNLKCIIANLGQCRKMTLYILAFTFSRRTTSGILFSTRFEKVGVFQRLGGFAKRRIRLCKATLEPARTQGSNSPCSATVRLSFGRPMCSKSVDNLTVQYPRLPSQLKQLSNRLSR